jgi:Protein of unknown function (DUF732)
MFSGIIRDFRALVVAVTVLIAAGIVFDGSASADSQDDKFFELLGQKDIGAVDNPSSLIDTGHKVCTKLDSGMEVGDLVELIRNNGFNDNPMARFYPQRRITATINRFITAAVQAYCPYDQGKIAPIVGPARWSARRQEPTGRVALVSLTRPLPSGEIPPTKPLPVPVQAPPVPEVPAPPQQPPPPPPRHVQQAPQRQQQVQPPPQQVEPAPAPEAPAPAPAPEAPAPAPEAPAPAEPPAAPPPPEPPAAPPPPPPSAPPPPPPPPPPEPKPAPGHIWLAP